MHAEKSFFDSKTYFDSLFNLEDTDGIKYLSWALWSEAEEMDALVDVLIKEYDESYKRIRFRSQMQQYRDTLKVILCNVLNRNGGEVGVSFSKAEYNKAKRYNPVGLTFRVTTSLIKYLSDQEYGYLELFKGTGSARNISYRSLVKAEDKLQILFADYGLRAEHLKLHPACETVFLQNECGKPIDYTDNEYITWRRRVLHEYSNHLRTVSFTVDGMPFRVEDPIRAIFSKSLERGGRVWGGFWQDCKSHYRKTITIDGEETTEVDIRNCSLRMAKQLSGESPDYSEDLYEVDDIPREVVKATVIVCLNCQRKLSIKQLHSPVKEKLKGTYDKGELLLMIHEVIKHFGAFGDEWFFKDKGTQILQRYEGMLCCGVIEEFLKVGKTVLTIHDGFIVKKEDYELVCQTIEAQYRRFIGNDPVLVQEH